MSVSLQAIRCCWLALPCGFTPWMGDPFSLSSGPSWCPWVLSCSFVHSCPVEPNPGPVPGPPVSSNSSCPANSHSRGKTWVSLKIADIPYSNKDLGWLSRCLKHKRMVPLKTCVKTKKNKDGAEMTSGASLDMCTLKVPMQISAPLQPMGKVQLGWLPNSQVFMEKPDVELRRSTRTAGPEEQRDFSSCGTVALLVTGAWPGPLAPSKSRTSISALSPSQGCREGQTRVKTLLNWKELYKA